MDPYEYFFNKLDFKLVKKSKLQRSNSLRTFYNGHGLSWNFQELPNIWNFFENDSQFGICFDDLYAKTDICRYAYFALHSCSKSFREQLNSAAKDFSKQFIDKCNITLQILNNFPNRLTSTAEIDILLTLNGMNIGA